MPLDKSKVTASKNPLTFSAKYAWLTLKHKWFVFQAGRKLNVPIIRLLKHDLSKFGPHELIHYGRQFFGPSDDPQGFAKCWLHHQNHNDHHWEYWVRRTGHDQDSSVGLRVPMDPDAITEMVADWMGASKAYDGKWPESGDWPWLRNNFNRIEIHPATRQLLEEMLEDYLKEKP